MTEISTGGYFVCLDVMRNPARFSPPCRMYALYVLRRDTKSNMKIRATD